MIASPADSNLLAAGSRVRHSDTRDSSPEAIAFSHIKSQLGPILDGKKLGAEIDHVSEEIYRRLQEIDGWEDLRYVLYFRLKAVNNLTLEQTIIPRRNALMFGIHSCLTKLQMTLLLA